MDSSCNNTLSVAVVHRLLNSKDSICIFSCHFLYGKFTHIIQFAVSPSSFNINPKYRIPNCTNSIVFRGIVFAFFLFFFTFFFTFDLCSNSLLPYYLPVIISRCHGNLHLDCNILIVQVKVLAWWWHMAKVMGSLKSKGIMYMTRDYEYYTNVFQLSKQSGYHLSYFGQTDGQPHSPYLHKCVLHCSLCILMQRLYVYH